MTDDLEDRADRSDLRADRSDARADKSAVRERLSDIRIDDLMKKVDKVSSRVDEIREWLIGEPEASALGRQLLSRARHNRQSIEELDRRLEVVEDWRTEWRGSWRLLVGFGTVLGIVATFFSLLAWFGQHP
jgi:hypothetical protein